MKRELLDILACPSCKVGLELKVLKEEGDEIIEGTLSCPSCGERYPIEDGIPNFLPPELRG